MARLSNSPQDFTTLTLEARKSFAFGMRFRNGRREPLNIAAADIRMVIGKSRRMGSGTLLTRDATVVDASLGLVQFELQADDLDLDADEYTFTVVLEGQHGYSTVVLKGIIDLVDNDEHESTTRTFSGINPSTNVAVSIEEGNLVDVNIDSVDGMYVVLEDRISDFSDEMDVKVSAASFFASSSLDNAVSAAASATSAATSASLASLIALGDSDAAFAAMVDGSTSLTHTALWAKYMGRTQLDSEMASKIGTPSSAARAALDTFYQSKLSLDSDIATRMNTVGGPTNLALENLAVSRTSRPKHAPALGLYFPEAEGAVGDGSHDDTDAIQAAINAMPSVGGIGGGTLVFSVGQYRVTDTITIDRHGVTLAGAGGYSSVILPGPELFGAAVFKFEKAGDLYRGGQVKDLTMNMYGSEAIGFLFISAYDQTLLQNVFVAGVGGAGGAFHFVTASGAPAPVSQTILANNCAAWGDASFTGKMWALHDVQEATFVGCKGIGGAESVGISWHIEDCRGVSLYNCSAGLCDVGFNIRSVDRPSAGIGIHNPTIEGAARSLVAVGTAAHKISRIHLSGVRAQLATSISAGPITLAHVTNSTLDVGTLLVTLGAECQVNHITTEVAGNVTDSGSYNTVMAWANATSPTSFSKVLSTRSAESPANRFYIPGQTGYWEMMWSGNSGTDSGFFIRRNDGSTNLHSWFVNGPRTEQRWYLHSNGSNREAMRLEAGPANDKSSMYLLVNDGSAVTLKQVELGAPDSAGTGFRSLRVSN